MKKKKLECNSINGITIGLIDSIINSLHLLSERDLSPIEVNEAVNDLLDQPLFVQFSNIRLKRATHKLVIGLNNLKEQADGKENN